MWLIYQPHCCPGFINSLNRIKSGSNFSSRFKKKLKSESCGKLKFKIKLLFQGDPVFYQVSNRASVVRLRQHPGHNSPDQLGRLKITVWIHDKNPLMVAIRRESRIKMRLICFPFWGNKVQIILPFPTWGIKNSSISHFGNKTLEFGEENNDGSRRREITLFHYNKTVPITLINSGTSRLSRFMSWILKNGF